MLLTSLLPMVCSACFLIEPQTNFPVIAPPTMDWALPTSITIIKCTIELPTGQSGGGIFSVEVPSSKMTPKLCKVDITLDVESS